MKKLTASLLLTLSILFGMSTLSIAQDDFATDETAEPVAEPMVQEPIATTPVVTTNDDMPVVDEDADFTQIIKDKFIEGDWRFMSPVLICLIIGLAIAIERIIMLNLATTNKTKLLNNVDAALTEGGVERAIEVTKATRGPIASIFTQGLMRSNEGIDMVEKSIISYGSVEMGRLEKGLVWISLFISLAPMLGFMGTVIGMIGAFDAIEAAGDISPSLVAGGIKVALLTTVAGLIVAIILQLFYNYLVSKVDSIVNNMEDASISVVDLLVKHSHSSPRV
jgi:biopolymer transport protein ExbB